MFQYTSETIINSAVGALANGTKRWDVVNDTLIIDGVTAVKLSDIKAIYHTPYMAEQKAKASIEIPSTVEAGEVLRLRVYLTEQGRSSSIMQNAYLHKAKPFSFEVKAPAAVTGENPVTVAAGAAKLFVKAIKEYMAQTDFKFFKAEVNASNAAKIDFEALDCYLRFASDRGVAMPVGGEVIELGTNNDEYLTAEEAYSVLTHGVVEKMGSQGAGTVARLVKDLRIPTSAKVDPFELKDGGMPVPGGKYDQYLIEVVTDRRHISGGVVGELGKSLTSFVLFIENDAKTAATIGWTAAILTSANLAKMNGGSGLTVEEAGVPVSSEVASGRRPASAGSDAAAEVYVASTGEVVKNK